MIDGKPNSPPQHISFRKHEIDIYLLREWKDERKLLGIQQEWYFFKMVNWRTKLFLFNSIWNSYNPCICNWYKEQCSAKIASQKSHWCDFFCRVAMSNIFWGVNSLFYWKLFFSSYNIFSSQFHHPHFIPDPPCILTLQTPCLLPFSFKKTGRQIKMTNQYFKKVKAVKRNTRNIDTHIHTNKLNP